MTRKILSNLLLTLLIATPALAQQGVPGGVVLIPSPPVVDVNSLTNPTVTGQIYCNDDSVTAPCYSWANDLTSGFYRIGNSNIGLALGGVNQINYATTGITYTPPQIINANGAASLPALKLAGTPYTGGTGTTTFPLFLFQNSAATAVTTWNTSGTYLGFNTNSGFFGDFLALYKNNSKRFIVSQDGTVTFSNGSNDSSISVAPSLAVGITEMVGGWFKRESTANIVTYMTGWYQAANQRIYGLYSPNANNAKLAIANMDHINTTQDLTQVPLQHIEAVVSGGNTGTATKTLDLGITYFGSATGNWYNYTITGDVTFTLSNYVKGGHYIIYLTIDGTGGYAQPTFTDTIHWDGGSAPTIDMTANKINVIEIWYDGTTLAGKATIVGGLN